MPNSKPIRVGVLFGGRSGEHEVSLASARNVMEALEKAGYAVAPIGITRAGQWLTSSDPMQQLTARVAGHLPERSNASGSNGQYGHDAKLVSSASSWGLLPQADAQNGVDKIDVIFPVLHGPYGEDGTVQGMLQMANLPYVGCGVLASAVAMDKAVAKKLFAMEGLRQVGYRVITRAAWRNEPASLVDALVQELTFPLFVKPANLGSSVGVSKARTPEELSAAIELACRYDRKIIVEKEVPKAREIEVSVLGNCHSANREPNVSIPGEILPSREFYDYTAKYEDDSSQLLIPARLDEAQVAEVQEMALRAFYAVDGAGLARVDFLLDGESQTLYLNEINTMPGFTQISMYPKLWEASGISYPELVDCLVQLALELHEDRQHNSVEKQ